MWIAIIRSIFLLHSNASNRIASNRNCFQLWTAVLERFQGFRYTSIPAPFRRRGWKGSGDEHRSKKNSRNRASRLCRVIACRRSTPTKTVSRKVDTIAWFLIRLCSERAAVMASRNVSVRPIHATLPYGQIHGQVVARVHTTLLLSAYLGSWCFTDACF